MAKAKAEKQGDKPDLITLEVAGRLLMIGADRVRQLIRAGYIEKPRHGYTTIVSAVQGYIRFLKEENRKHTKSAAASRATDARAKEIELRIAERQRELIPIEDARAEISQFVQDTRAEIVGMGARITRDMELRRQIDKECDGILTRLALRAEKASHALETESGASDASAEDNA